MEKSSSSSSSDGSRELQCVGRLEIVRPKPVGFLCGSIPVPTDTAFHTFNSALVPSSQTVRAPRYQIIPPETDLNSPPLLPNIREKVLPIAAARTGTDLPYESGAITSNLTMKGEALAVSGVAEHGDDLDVIAPADILKQIFKIPYSKARLSIAVHRIGQTLVLNTGPDAEEGEKLVRRRNNHSQCEDKSLFLNFAMHSVRMEACDCPPAHHAPLEEKSKSNSSFLPGRFESMPQVFGQDDDIAQGEGMKDSFRDPHVKKDSFIWGSKKNKRNKSQNAVKKVSQVKEKPKSLLPESEKYRRPSSDGFLKVLFWKFHNFRMLLGSDLLIFSNEKYVAVSLHLWDVSRQVTPVTWLEAWLDNVMASVPELAICYHQKGVVQGYELLKTDDIFLSKGISEDGTPAFHPHIVQQNGHSVLRFLQENCKQDPGAYWLYKSAGADSIQLFDLSLISKKHTTNDSEDSSSSQPSIIHRGTSDTLLSLGTLLYRIAHRLSLSMAPNNRARCASFFKKCLDFLDEPDHLVVRATAHEQFARLLLTYDEELDLASEALSVESKASIADVGDESFEFFSCSSESIVHEIIYSPIREDEPKSEYSTEISLNGTISPSKTLTELSKLDSGAVPISSDQNVAVQTVVDPISSKLAAIHHVSQAIKSLRWKRQLQSTENGLGKAQDGPPLSMDFSVCACGDPDCIEICDIREWLPTSKLDDKLWKLVLLLGESYLALGQAYKDEGQLQPALRVVKLACLVYGSMPQHLEYTRFVSSMICSPIKDTGNTTKGNSKMDDDYFTPEQLSSTYLFWAKAWTLVGDVYVDFHMIKGKDFSTEKTRELKMSSEVLKEVKRLNKKLGQFNQNCSSCSLVNCSCQSDRANSGNSASSSKRDTRALGYGRKQSKKGNSKSVPTSRSGASEGDHVHHKGESGTRPKTSQTATVGAVEATDTARSTVAETAPSDKKVKNGGIFKYLQGPLTADTENNLSASLSCYEAASKALSGYPTSSAELQSVIKKKGWVCNEMGRTMLEKKESCKAELAFAKAIKSFKEVSDHTNIILINCNLGHGRRALAEEMLHKIETLKLHAIFHSAYNQTLESAKLKYAESLKFYGAAKTELNSVGEESGLRNEVYTQLANTYLRLGMLLARENSTAKIYENGFVEDFTVTGVQRGIKEFRKHEVSANDAIREAVALYESLGELRKQEAAYAYFQLACYQRDCCLRFLELDQKKSDSKGEISGLQRVKQYASLAERNWQKSRDFYGPRMHPMMYLTILMERSTLSLSLSSSFQLNVMLESALTRLLEGRHVSEDKIPDSLRNENGDVYDKFRSQLQMLLKKMLSVALSTSSNNKSSVNSEQTNSHRSGDAGKLRELYKMALKPTDFSQLHAMHKFWTS